MRSLKRSILSVLLGSIVIIACSSQPDSAFVPTDEITGPADKTPKPSGPTGEFGAGAAKPENSPSNPGDFAACASTVADGLLRPVHIVLAIDLSYSMCETNEVPDVFVCNDPKSKWGQVKAGLDGFFKSPESIGLYASIIPWSGDECASFNKSITPDTALPDASGILSTTLAKQRPDGGTPTHAAIEGALSYGQGLQKNLSDGGKVITIMVTDGMPSECSSMPQSLASATASNKAGFPVYVIGVGQEAANLKSLAAAGGTTDAFNVSATADLLAALKTIRGSALGCSLALPKAPAGQTLNLQQVNVLYDTGTSKTVPYSQDCSVAGGWKYTPSAAAASGIELCEGSCSDVRKAPIGTGKLKLVLGCETSTKVK